MNKTPDAPPAELADLQRAFADHLRDAAAPCPSGVAPRRAAAYRELLLNNVEGILLACFPVTHAVLGPDRWQVLVQDFFQNHRSHSPYFRDIPGELLHHLNTARPPATDEPPFLRELLHYEWVELALSVDPTDPGTIRVNPEGDLLTGIPVVNPLAWTFRYRYPVHTIGPDTQPQSPAPAHLVVIRRRDHGVGFLELNAITARLFEHLGAETQCGRAILEKLAAEIAHPNPEALVTAGANLLADLTAREVLLGTRPETAAC